MKTRFVIVGSGWRSLYFVRIAKALPELFDMCALLCRSEEKAQLLAAEHQIHTTTSWAECAALHPDFVVVAVSKDDLAEVSLTWMARGFTVLCETPAAMNVPMLKRLWQAGLDGGKLVIAEQYTRYPINTALLNVLADKPLGDVTCLDLSQAHEYHAASLMRAFLGTPVGTPFTIRAKGYMFPTAETLSRCERFTDGRVADKQRTVADIEFANGQLVRYDFDSEQYRSPIRQNHMKLQGVRGELMDGCFYLLDQQNRPVVRPLEPRSRTVLTESDNPNLHTFEEITEVRWGQKIVYEPPFGLCGLSQDETAIALLMQGTAAYAAGAGDAPMPLADALEDAYVAILMREAAESGAVLHSKRMPWHP